MRASDGDLLLAPDVHLDLEPEPEPEPESEPFMLSLTGVVTGAANEAIKMLSQSEKDRRVELQRTAATERSQASSMDAELSGVQAEIEMIAADASSVNGSPVQITERHNRPAPLIRQLSLPNVQSSLFRMDVPLERAALLELQLALPQLLQAFDWSLKYRLSQDGASQSTLLRQSGILTPLLLIAKVRRFQLRSFAILH